MDKTSGDTKPSDAEKTDTAAAALTAEQAAKACKVKPADVLAFRDAGTYVIVVTVAGLKINSADVAAEAAAKAAEAKAAKAQA